MTEIDKVRLVLLRRWVLLVGYVILLDVNWGAGCGPITLH